MTIRDYDPRAPGLLTWHDARPGFHEGTDTPRAYLERCLETIAIREPEVRAFTATAFTVASPVAESKLHSRTLWSSPAVNTRLFCCGWNSA